MNSHYRAIAGMSLSLFLLPHTATRADSAYAWGYPVFGELGIGITTPDQNAPVPVLNMSSGVTMVAAGSHHSLAVKNGTLFTWGANNHGQLGIGSTSTYTYPPDFGALTGNITAIAAGGDLSLAVMNGALYAWGNGPLGNGGFASQSSPTLVSALNGGVTAIAAGGAPGAGYALAVQNGAAYAWGINDYGQLGSGDLISHNIPTPVVGLTSGVTAVAAGNQHSLAIKNGAAYAWGDPEWGALGYGASERQPLTTPASVIGLASGVTSIAAGDRFSVAVKNGAVYTWGSGTQGGDSFHSTPFQVPGLTNIVQVAAASGAAFALSADGSLWVWGSNDTGQLGLGDFFDRQTPTHLFAPAGFRFTSIDADALPSGSHVLATLAAVPEPASLTFLTLTLTTLVARRRRA